KIHPILLPSFPGLEAQKQALEHGVKWSGCTVHFVTRPLTAGQSSCSALYRSIPMIRLRVWPRESWKKNTSFIPRQWHWCWKTFWNYLKRQQMTEEFEFT